MRKERLKLYLTALIILHNQGESALGVSAIGIKAPLLESKSLGETKNHQVLAQASTKQETGTIGSSYKALYSIDDSLGTCLTILGFILVPLSQALLYSNERRQARQTSFIDKARKACINLDCNTPANPMHNQSLVYVTGKTSSAQSLQDSDFGVIAKNSYRLTRRVEMYQWLETFHEATKT